MQEGGEHLKVLDLGRLVAGPFVASLLGDFGAEVVKVEIPGEGDPLRHAGEGPPGRSYIWQVEGRNKRSLALDWRRPEGRAVLARLIEWCDVLVENFRPGVMAKYQLGYEDVRPLNPGIVYVSVSGYGHTGPYAERGAVDMTSSAFGGLTHLTGEAGGRPLRPGMLVTDFMAGLYAAVATLQAVWRRDNGTGVGDWIDLALYEPLLRMGSGDFRRFAADGVAPMRSGGKSANAAPSDVYATTDGNWIAVAAPTTQTFAALCKLIDDPVLDSGVASAPTQVERAQVVEDAVAAWVAVRTRATCLAQLVEAGVPAAAVNSVADLFDDPHIAARGNLVEVAEDEGPPAVMQNAFPAFANFPARVRWSGEGLGASTRQVLKMHAGMSDEEIDDLRALGVVAEWVE